MPKLTDRQREILDYLIDYHLEHNEPPSIRTVGDHFGVHHSAIYGHLVALDKKGYMESRTIAKGIRTEYDG